jgi:light-regulated signal transduction histidine kinase (bacteriophytochrome)
MSTANSKQARYATDDLEASLHAETKLRFEVEDRLRQTQEDFQEFMLSAVHDLREPLRTVNAYCELLSKKNSDVTEAEADQFRRYILEGTTKIQSLLGGMVEYATAGAASRYIIHVELNDVFREAASSIEQRPGKPPAKITADSLPVVKGDFEKLVKVFRHLFVNGSMYCEDPEPRLHVSAERDGPDWLLSVRDNGPGVEAAYHQRIFAPFKRLHGRQYAGIGLGLSFCQKAVESHGGRIWVESTPGKGSTFCFTLPAD